jgi:hypothetical protein
VNFKTADNILAGIEVSVTSDIVDGFAKIINATVFGMTNNTEESLRNASSHGIITPRTENFRIEGAYFSGFDWTNPDGVQAAPLGTCSHCYFWATSDSGAR